MINYFITKITYVNYRLGSYLAEKNSKITRQFLVFTNGGAIAPPP